jgi:hypothetical protein
VSAPVPAACVVRAVCSARVLPCVLLGTIALTPRLLARFSLLFDPLSLPVLCGYFFFLSYLPLGSRRCRLGPSTIADRPQGLFPVSGDAARGVSRAHASQRRNARSWQRHGHTRLLALEGVAADKGGRGGLPPTFD